MCVWGGGGGEGFERETERDGKRGWGRKIKVKGGRGREVINEREKHGIILYYLLNSMSLLSPTVSRARQVLPPAAVGGTEGDGWRHATGV